VQLIEWISGARIAQAENGGLWRKMTISARIEALGMVLPPAAAPIANYVPVAITRSLAFVSGQLCLGSDGRIANRHLGKVGRSVLANDATEAAGLCVLNILAQMDRVLGSLDRIKKCVRLGGFINAAPEFTALPTVMNGASDLMVAIFYENGIHTRTTVGVASLPLDACIEVEALFEIEGA
jgi:enamine deaminase RidA (YjgF/YER057c/UK114 family)